MRTGQAVNDYDFSTEPSDRRPGKRCAVMRARVEKPRAFATLMQEVLADDYRGRRLRMSGWLRSDKVAGHGAIWMRIDGPDRRMLAFDNMHSRPVHGTTPWQRYDVVLDVGTDAAIIAFGLLLDGGGALWLDEPAFDIVGPDVPTTETEKPRAPQNLDFIE